MDILVPAPIAPNAQSVIAIVFLIVLAVFFVVIIISPAPGAKGGDFTTKFKKNKFKSFAWIGLILAIALAIAFAFQSALLSLSPAGQQAAMMANVVLGILFIVLSIPCIAGFKDEQAGVAVSSVTLVLAVLYIVCSAAVYSQQALLKL